MALNLMRIKIDNKLISLVLKIILIKTITISYTFLRHYLH